MYGVYDIPHSYTGFPLVSNVDAMYGAPVQASPVASRNLIMPAPTRAVLGPRPKQPLVLPAPQFVPGRQAPWQAPSGAEAAQRARQQRRIAAQRRRAQKAVEKAAQKSVDQTVQQVQQQVIQGAGGDAVFDTGELVGAHLQESAKKASPLPFIVGVVVVFGLGYYAVQAAKKKK